MVDEPEEVLQETGGEEPVEEPQEPEQTTEETVEAEGEAQTEAETEESEIKSERGQKRVQQLANERNELRQENQTLRQVIQEEPRTVSPEQVLPPWVQPKADFKDIAGQELTPEQYEQHLTVKAREIASLEVANLREEMTFKNNLEQDVSYLERTYPELSGELADPAIAKAINQAKTNFALAYKADHNVRLKDFIEPLMDVRRGAEQQGRATASARLQDQAASAAPLTQKTNASRVSSEEELMRQLDAGEISIEEAEKQIAKLHG